VLRRGQPSHLSQQGMIADGEQGASSTLVHRFTLREVESGCQHGDSPSPPRKPLDGAQRQVYPYSSAARAHARVTRGRRDADR
jgi:hypothetical protein